MGKYHQSMPFHVYLYTISLLFIRWIHFRIDFQLGEEYYEYVSSADVAGEDSHDYVNGFYSSISHDNSRPRYNNDDLNYSEKHFKRKTAERSSTFFRGLLPRT